MSPETKGLRLASFTASLRRPRPLATGIVAEMFAANGPDADATLVLGKSELQDSLVLVDLGEDMGSFQGHLRRPEPKITGMVVRIFGEDGKNADCITALGLSKFLDQLVTVTVTQLQTPEGAEVKPVAPKVTGVVGEKPAAILWKCSLWGDPKAWARFGSEASYNEWLQDHPENMNIGAFRARRNWGWKLIKEELGLESMGDATANDICGLFARLGLLDKLPASLRDAAQAQRLGAGK